MRRLLQSLTAAAVCGILATASNAAACQATRSGAQDRAREVRTTSRASPLKKGSPDSKKGALDDRLIRPRLHLDASAGSLG